MFETNVDIVKGEYGIWEYNEKKKAKVFKALGKAVAIDSITDNIETGSVQLELSFDYIGEEKHYTLSRTAYSDHMLLQELAGVGADITKKNFNVFIDSLRLQEADMEAAGIGTQKVYEHLGWISIPTIDSSGNYSKKLCYRANTLIGPCNADYIGPLKLKTMGSFEAWKAMVEDEIIGHPPAEVTMLASLSAVTNGLISTHTTGENAMINVIWPGGVDELGELLLQVVDHRSKHPVKDDFWGEKEYTVQNLKCSWFFSLMDSYRSDPNIELSSDAKKAIFEIESGITP